MLTIGPLMILEVLTMMTPTAGPCPAAALAAELMTVGADLLQPVQAIADGDDAQPLGLLCLAGDLLELAALSTPDAGRSAALHSVAAMAWGLA